MRSPAGSHPETTTIKVSRALRDRLQEGAASGRTTLAGAIEELLRTAARAERFDRMRAERAGSAPAEAHDGLLEQTALDDLGRVGG